jgi:hypothetical protein
MIKCSGTNQEIVGLFQNKIKMNKLSMYISALPVRSMRAFTSAEPEDQMSAPRPSLVQKESNALWAEDVCEQKRGDDWICALDQQKLGSESDCKNREERIDQNHSTEAEATPTQNKIKQSQQVVDHSRLSFADGSYGESKRLNDLSRLMPSTLMKKFKGAKHGRKPKTIYTLLFRCGLGMRQPRHHQFLPRVDLFNGLLTGTSR